MNCREYLAELHDYFMGKLPRETMASIDAHAARCKDCGALMARAKELSCREFTEFLNEYVDGALAPERRTIFERHVEICPDCQNYLQSYKDTMKASVLAFREQGPLPPKAIPEDLVLAILKAGPKGRKP
jgi:anti-sigma factor RsiW